MALIELVDFNTLYENDKPKKKSRRRGSKKATTEAAAEVVEAQTDAPETVESPEAVAETEAPKAPETEAADDDTNKAE